MKKILTIILVILLIASVPCTAFASEVTEEPNTITVTKKNSSGKDTEDWKIVFSGRSIDNPYEIITRTYSYSSTGSVLIDETKTFDTAFFVQSMLSQPSVVFSLFALLLSIVSLCLSAAQIKERRSRV